MVLLMFLFYFKGMESVMQTVLVDIYNLCHRNKQIARQAMSSSSSISSDTPNISTQCSVEIADAIAYEDVFHPEASKQEITPFSPVASSPLKNQGPIMFPNHFDFAKQNSAESVASNTTETGSPTTVSLGNDVIPAFEGNVKARSHSDSMIKIPDPGMHNRRTRFSVTKIWDSLGNHAAGVANKIATNVGSFDTKMKKRTSKEKLELVVTSEMVPVLDQNNKENVQEAIETNIDYSCVAVSNEKNSINPLRSEESTDKLEEWSHDGHNASNSGDVTEAQKNTSSISTEHLPGSTANSSFHNDPLTVSQEGLCSNDKYNSKTSNDDTENCHDDPDYLHSIDPDHNIVKSLNFEIESDSKPNENREFESNSNELLTQADRPDYLNINDSLSLYHGAETCDDELNEILLSSSEELFCGTKLKESSCSSSCDAIIDPQVTAGNNYLYIGYQ